ncbi:MAG TPA: NADH-quinone oxidoreductase subunit C, partial [Burkholderiales bacterium]|nr:NADH-quinone oxidoreductase subunit C [Burkholderiales bacterium]
MKLEDFPFETRPLPGAMPVWVARVEREQWRSACEMVRDKGGRLVALWGADHTERGAGYIVYAALTVRSGLLIIALIAEGERYPDLSQVFPAANRMQRAVRDLYGLEAEQAADTRKWLRHAAWPEEVFPLRKAFDARQTFPNGVDRYPFVEVGGEGVHEIPVGPVHAGTIEPGHFRFSIVGEGILRLEERLGYKHKGIEKRFESMTLAEGAKLAGRISGDSTVAYAWAYAMAVESVTASAPPPRALWLRALLLERERVGQHLWDLGFLGNDAGLAFGLAQFSRLREDWLRTSHALFGHRYLMDVIVPGGVARDIRAESIVHMRSEAETIGQAVASLKTIYDEHAGLQDRFIGCGRVK